MIRRCFVLAVLLGVLSGGFAVGEPASFYVQPDALTNGDGSAARPWRRLTDTAWKQIDRALSADDVAVFFCARGSTGRDVPIARTDDSPHRLTLDGMSRYKADEEAATWKENRTAHRHRITARYPIGTGRTKRNRVTVRGFHLVATCGQGVAYWGGDHVVVEHCVVTSREPEHGPGIIFGYAHHKGDKPGNGGCVDITIRHNTVHHVYGEGIYVGGVEGQNLPGHDGVLIEGNTIHDVAHTGGEGDAIDIKDANRNVVVRGNTVYMTEPGAARDGIVIGGAALVEGNFIYNFGRCGISLGTFWNGFPNRKGAVVRNNIIVNCGGSPRYTWDYGLILGGSRSGDQFSDALICNNTICGIRSDRPGQGTGIEIRREARGTRLWNNLVCDCAGPALNAGRGSLGEHGHNAFFSRTGGVLVQHGSRRYAAENMEGFEPDALTTDPLLIRPTPPFAPGGFAPKPGSPAIDAARPLPSFDHDFNGATRPAGRWDIGAVEAPPPPDR